jgi:hypothetical protein
MTTDAGSREGKYEVLIALAVFAVVTLMLGYPALGGQFLVNSNSDQYIAGFAFRDFAATTLKETGTFPLWNPYLFSGLPYVAAMHGDEFYPTFLLRWIMPTDVAMTWGFIIHLWLAGTFTWLFLRRALGLGFQASLLGGLGYMLGGNVAGLVSPGHDGKLFVSALLPLVLFFVHRGVRDGRAWAWGGLVVSVTLAVLTPHPQLLQYLLILSGAYALFLTLSTDGLSQVLPAATRTRRLVFAGGAVGLGMLGGAVQFWPLLEYTPWSPRAGGKGWDHAVSYSMPPEELFNGYLPQFSGMLMNYSGANGIHLHSEYFGVVVLMCAGLAFGAAVVSRRMQWFWAGALLLSVLWALGGNTPFYKLVYALVPGTSFFRAPSTMLYIVSFCLSVLAAIGADRVLSGRVARSRLLVYLAVWGVFAGVVALLGATGGLTTLARGFAIPGREARVEENAAALALGAWRSLAVVAVTALLLLGVTTGRITRQVGAWALAAVLTVDSWSIARNYWQFSEPAAQLYAGDAITDYLTKIEQPGRVLPLAIQELGGTRRDPYFGSGDGRATGFMVHRIRTPFGYHGNELGRYQLLTGWDQEELHISNPNLWRLLNIQYLYANGPKAPIPDMTLVAGPVRNAAGNMAYLYKFPDTHPLAWVVPALVGVDSAAVVPTLLDAGFDVRRVALADQASGLPTSPVPTTLPEPLTTTVSSTSWAPGRMSLRIDGPVPAGAALVVSENYYPGWTATVDGAAASIGRVNESLIGVTLPANAKAVTLAFTSPRYERGKLITLAVLALGVLWWSAGWFASRRTVRPV